MLTIFVHSHRGVDRVLVIIIYNILLRVISLIRIYAHARYIDFIIKACERDVVFV